MKKWLRILVLLSVISYGYTTHDSLTLVYNLVHGINVKETEERVESYRTQHANIILAKRAEKLEEEQRMDAMIAEERRMRALRLQDSIVIDFFI